MHSAYKPYVREKADPQARPAAGCIGTPDAGHKRSPGFHERGAGRSCLPLILWAGLTCASGCAVATITPSPEHVPLAAPAAWDYRDWSTVLRENVRDGLVDYEHLKAHREPLEHFYGAVSVSGPQSTPALFKSPTDRAAYWINVYNALVLRAVLERYPTETMYGLQGPALETDFMFHVDRRTMNLLAVKKKLEEVSRNDPRVTFCLCAAARGCPPLAPEPYHGFDLERRLRETARQAVDNDDLVRIDHMKRRLLVWLDLFSRRKELIARYERRYRTHGATLLTVLNTYADSRRRGELATARGYKVEQLPFDRRLNIWKPAS